MRGPLALVLLAAAPAWGGGALPIVTTSTDLQALVEAKVSPEVISRLRATLLEDKSFTERGLKDAVFGEEVQP